MESCSGGVQLSNINYMNDPEELEFGLSVLRNIVSKNFNENEPISEIFKKTEVSNIKSKAYSISQRPIFIFSFSEEADQLSQWNKYANNGNGVCIRTHIPKLHDILSNETKVKYLINPIEYFDNKYNKITSNYENFEKSIISFLENMNELLKDENIFRKEIIQFYEVCQYLSTFIKNEFYMEEKEIRLLIFVSGKGDKSIDVLHDEKYGLKPIFKISFMYDSFLKNNDDPNYSIVGNGINMFIDQIML